MSKDELRKNLQKLSTLCSFNSLDFFMVQALFTQTVAKPSEGLSTTAMYQSKNARSFTKLWNKDYVADISN